MLPFEKKEVIQAILIADNNVENFRPLSDNKSTILLPLANVALLDYALEALNRSGIEEVFLYCRLFINDVQKYIQKSIEKFSSWSVNMKVHVIGGESCRSFGDVMRDIDAKALIRGHFILMSTETITNVDMRPILEQHKKTCKYDKGAAATIIFKEASSIIRTGNEVMIAIDAQNKRLHHHQRIKINSKESTFDIPLEVFLINSHVTLHNNLIDPKIAIGSPSMLSLFSDNFDFETRDDFIRGILINEDILDSRIYVSLLPNENYARKVNNWLSYQIVSNDIINRWAYPLVPDMAICSLKQNYIFLKNNIYKSPEANLNIATLRENVVIQAGSKVESSSTLTNCVIGRNCKIEKNCSLKNAYIMDNCIIEEECVLNFCVIGFETVIGAKSILNEGTVIGDKCIIPAKTTLTKVIVTSSLSEEDKSHSKQISAKAFILDDTYRNYASDCDEANLEPIPAGIPKMTKLPITYEESDYTSSSEEDDSQQEQESIILDDANIFLSEVMDSLARGYQEKSNPDFLILEINSSRYAYNMSLKEVNFNVIKAIFSLQEIKEPANRNVLVAINNVIKQLGPVVLNYIKTPDSMLDCLKALEECCEENTYIREKIPQIIHYLYDKEIISEESIIVWHNQLNNSEQKWLKTSLSKLIEWLNQSSSTSSEEE